MDVAHQAAGLKNWVRGRCVNHVAEQPLFQGAATLAMAPHIYRIVDLGNDPMSLI